MRARPYYLDLRHISLPIGAWVSILHRGSGAVMALAVPGLLYVFMLSLRSPEDFERVVEGLNGFYGWVLSTGLIWALLHHSFAGLRHLGFDLGWGESKTRARQTAWLSLLLAIGITVIFVLERF